MFFRIIRYGLLVLALAVMSCRSGSREFQPRFAEPERGIELQVKNDNFYDATLYAVNPGGSKRRLGRISGKSQKTFEFRWSSTEIRIEIELLSVGSTLTDVLPVSEDDTLELVITPDLHFRIPPGAGL